MQVNATGGAGMGPAQDPLAAPPPAQPSPPTAVQASSGSDTSQNPTPDGGGQGSAQDRYDPLATQLQYTVRDDGKLKVRIVDTRNGETVREVPPDRVLKSNGRDELPPGAPVNAVA